MDIRTGKTYDTREDAIQDGVPDSDIAEVRPGDLDPAKPRGPIVTFTNGPFKDRRYRRTEHGLVRLR